MSRESFINRDKDHGNASYRRARKQEKELAVRLGGRRTAASGSKGEKGDVRVRGLLRVEAKTTKHKSFSVTLDMVNQIEDAALGSDELPCILVEFITPEGKPVREVAIVPSYVLFDLIQK
jgi:hypothetical protein